MNKVKMFIISILIPVFIGLMIGLVTSPGSKYTDLNQPFLAPPGWIFPIVWTILYVLMGVSYGILKVKGLINEKINKVYFSQLVVNALWSIIFFNLGWRFFAFLWIILLAIMVINMIIDFYNYNRIAGLLQIPYLIWISFATYLNFGFYILNR